MRKFIEKLVEGGFLISGSVSSFTILLIIFFLFKEAAGLFNSPEILDIISALPEKKLGCFSAVSVWL